MPTFARRTEVPVSADDLFAWHERPGAFVRLTPPWQPVELVQFEGIRDGDRAVIELGPGPFPLRWVAEHEGYREGRQFRDVQVSGPFARWEHTHRMLPHDVDTRRSVLEDRIAYELPLEHVSEPLAGRRAQDELARLFAYRHRVTREDLRRHAEAGLRPLTVAITGSSGLIGSALAAFLTSGGHSVVHLVRNPAEVLHRPRSGQEEAVFWDPVRAEIEPGILNGVDAVVHLAGEPVLGRWTRQKKAAIFDSRVRGTRFLAETLAALPHPPPVLLSASGSGYYGSRGAERLSEEAAPGEGFMARVCQAWEDATEPSEQAGIRVCHLRMGVVLSPKGGLLRAALPVFRVGLGGAVGNGHAWVPWIALDDVLYAMLHLLTRPDVRGPVNVVAPTPVSQKSFTETLGRVLRRPTPLRAPAPLLRAVGGQMAEETALISARATPDRLMNSGFRFAYPHLGDALRHLLGRAAEESVDV